MLDVSIFYVHLFSEVTCLSVINIPSLSFVFRVFQGPSARSQSDCSSLVALSRPPFLTRLCPCLTSRHLGGSSPCSRATRTLSLQPLITPQDSLSCQRKLTVFGKLHVVIVVKSQSRVFLSAIRFQGLVG